METNKLLTSDNKPYSVIQKGDGVSIYFGEKVVELDSLDDLDAFKESVKSKVVFILPFSLSGREKGHNYIGEEPILAMKVEEEINLSKDKLLSILPEQDLGDIDITPSISDEDFREMVVDFKYQIDNGNVCQGILSRKFEASLSDTQKQTLLSIYKRVVGIEGGYMNYLFDSCYDVFMGASPERHITVEGDKVMKNPIAGTIPKKTEGFYESLEEFLLNKKEENELSMVTDEELKMMMKITRGGMIEGPKLREIGKVVHTEFDLVGLKGEGVRTIDCLKNTLYSPTIVGGPLEAAFNLIAQYERQSRGYYGTAFGVFDGEDLDTTIPIRSAVINKKDNSLSVRAGAGIVADSDPDLEVEETRAKAEGFLSILRHKNLDNPMLLNLLSIEQRLNIDSILEDRKNNLSGIYLKNEIDEDLTVEEIVGKKFVIINNGDDFVYMISYLIEKMGGVCDIVENSDYISSDNFDFTLLGPGPGDINDKDNKKMQNLLKIAGNLKESNSKTLGICLGHQALCKSKGLDISHQEEIRQGKQKDVDIFGKKEKVAFYNSFSPVLDREGSFEEYELYDDDRLLYQKSDNSVSVQFHPESIMSVNGFEILKNMILKLV